MKPGFRAGSSGPGLWQRLLFWFWRLVRRR